jgi:hypothetical protein
MRLRKAKHLTLALVVATGLGVFAKASGAQQSSSQKKPSYTKSGAKTGSKSTGKSGSSTKSSSAKSGTSSHHSKTTKTSGKSSRRDKGQKTPTPERISEIQQALAKNGAYSGTPSGKWDDSTVDAMKNFQETHGLNPTGKLDAKTLQQLGLGSQTAGVAPPMPPISSSSLTTPAESTHRQQ